MPPKKAPAAARSVLVSTQPLGPRKVAFEPSMVTEVLKIDPAFERDMRDGGRLAGLLDNPPPLAGEATRLADGRLTPIILAVVRDTQGTSHAGVLVRLLQDDVFCDASHTNERGGVVLSLPGRKPSEWKTAVSGTLEIVVDGTPIRKNVTVPAAVQHVMVEFLLDTLPPAMLKAGPYGLMVPIADNPLDRLPADFTTAMCADLSKVLSPAASDPILGQTGGAFPAQRLPSLIRLTVPRLGDPWAQSVLPPRYLVRVRQEWNFLSYTLGELTEVASLDPGEILQIAERVAEQTQNSVDSVLREALSVVNSVRQQLSSIDTVVANTASTANAIAASGLGGSGFGVLAGAGAGAGIGALVGGPVGAVVGGVAGAIFGGLFGGGGPLSAAATPVSTLTTTLARTSSDTSLLVNSLQQTSQRTVNQAIKTLTSTARSIERATNQVSPLLSRVTNLVRWVVYENYAVCTKVEEILEVEARRITTGIGANVPLFSDEDIVDYERIFSPRMLEPKLRPHFDLLRRAIAARNSAHMPVSRIRIFVDYSSSGAGADFTMTIPSVEPLRVELRPGLSRAFGFIHLPTPLTVQANGSLGTATMGLAFRSDLSPGPIPLPFGGSVTPASSLTVTAITLLYESVPGSSNDQEHQFTGLTVSNTTPSTPAQTLALVVPQAAVFTEFDALFVHINRNREYYFGLLCQAALAEPSLRDDAPQLASFNGDNPLWRLPIIGFEGDRALILRAPLPNDPNVAKFKADEGAASVVQLASPGAYSEALQGVLELTDAIGKLHPALLPVPAPAVPPIALIDLTGKTIAGLPGTGGGGGTAPGGIVTSLPLSTSALGAPALAALLAGTGPAQFTVDNARLIALGIDPTKIDRVISAEVSPVRTVAGAAVPIPSTPASLALGTVTSNFNLSGAAALIPGTNYAATPGGSLASPVGVWKLTLGQSLPVAAIAALSDVVVELLIETHA